MTTRDMVHDWSEDSIGVYDALEECYSHGNS